MVLFSMVYGQNRIILDKQHPTYSTKYSFLRAKRTASCPVTLAGEESEPLLGSTAFSEEQTKTAKKQTFGEEPHGQTRKRVESRLSWGGSQPGRPGRTTWRNGPVPARKERKVVGARTTPPIGTRRHPTVVDSLQSTTRNKQHLFLVKTDTEGNPKEGNCLAQSGNVRWTSRRARQSSPSARAATKACAAHSGPEDGELDTAQSPGSVKPMHTEDKTPHC